MKNTPPQGAVAPWGRRWRRRRGIFSKMILKTDTFSQDFLKICQVQTSGMHASRVFLDHTVSQGTQVTICHVMTVRPLDRPPWRLPFYLFRWPLWLWPKLRDWHPAQPCVTHGTAQMKWPQRRPGNTGNIWKIGKLHPDGQGP